MPHFTTQLLCDSPALRVARVTCDGIDEPRVRGEQVGSDRIWLVQRGSFQLRTRAGVRVLDPSVAVLLPRGAEYAVTHEHAEEDVCLSISGVRAGALVARRDGMLPLDASAWLQLRAAADALGQGETRAGLALEELLTVALDAPARVTQQKGRGIAEAIAHEVQRRFDERLALDALARSAGVSVSHACHAFRAAAGMPIHQYQLELRLRHALALVLDTQRPLAEVALAAGFASQAHLTSRFHRRFGVTPAACRKGRMPLGLRP